jgi:hypothetical protein
LRGADPDHPGPGERAALGAFGQAGLVLSQRLADSRHPARDRGPVLLGCRRHVKERAADPVRRPEDVRDGPQVLTLRAHRQSRVEALAQQPGATALVAGEFPAHPPEGGERCPGEIIEGLLAGWGEIRQPVLARAHAERGGQDGFELRESADEAVGDVAYGSRF